MNRLNLFAGLLVSGLTPTLNAQVINLKNSAVPEISIRVGGGGKAISTVVFDIPATNVADGTPIPGGKKIRIDVQARATPSNSRLVSLQADSSQPLTNGSIVLPFTEFYWTAKKGDIPSGVFNGGTQVLLEFFNSRRIFDMHDYVYANTLPVAVGTYNGQVVYTLTMP